MVLLFLVLCSYGGGGGGGRTRANSVCFPKNWKNLSVDQQIKDAVVYGWGRQIFTKSLKNKTKIH